MKFNISSQYVYCINKNKKYKTKTLGDVSYPKNTLDKYGGWINGTETSIGFVEKKYTATGFFYTIKDNNGWYLVDPEGHQFISMGLNSVELDNDGFLKNYTESGLNTLGCWSDWESINQKYKIPYTRRTKFLADYINTQPNKDLYKNKKVIPVFGSFQNYCDEYAKQLTSTKDDKFLLGHFSDNEIFFYYSNTYGKVLERFLILPENDENYTYTINWLNLRGKTKNNFTQDDVDDFRQHIVDTYYRIVSSSIKKYDPNHLYLGTRFHGGAKQDEKIILTAAKYLDVISVNYYNSWNPYTKYMNMWVSSGKPFIISEFYVKGEDTGMDNNEGAGWIVRTQKDRSLFYTNFVIRALRHPGCVGLHWHRYSDKDQTSNKGMVNKEFKWFEEMKNEINKVLNCLYNFVEYLR